MPSQLAHRLGRWGGLLVLAALPASVLVPVASASASANAFTAVERAYSSSPTQTIPPCTFSAGELAEARSSVPNDNQQYDQGLTAAIDQARQQRAGGACRAKKHGAAATLPVGTPVPPRVPPLGRGAPLPLGSAPAATDSGLPAPIAILAVFAGLFAIAGAALGAARVRGWDPQWLVRSRHAWSEAGYRVSGIWSEFGDWLRGVPH